MAARFVNIDRDTPMLMAPDMRDWCMKMVKQLKPVASLFLAVCAAVMVTLPGLTSARTSDVAWMAPLDAIAAATGTAIVVEQTSEVELGPWCERLEFLGQLVRDDNGPSNLEHALQLVFPKAVTKRVEENVILLQDRQCEALRDANSANRVITTRAFKGRISEWFDLLRERHQLRIGEYPRTQFLLSGSFLVGQEHGSYPGSFASDPEVEVPAITADFRTVLIRAVRSISSTASASIVVMKIPSTNDYQVMVDIYAVGKFSK